MELTAPSKEDEDDGGVLVHFTGYPLLLSYDRTWSCQRMRHHIWLNTIRYFQPSSDYVRQSLEFLATSNIVKQMEKSQHFPIRIISNDGGPMMSSEHKRLLLAAKRKPGGAFPPPSIDDLDMEFGSILPLDKALTIEEFTGDIERFYPSGAIYFSLDVIVETKAIIDTQHFKSLDAVVTTRSAAAQQGITSSSSTSQSSNILSLDDCLKEYTKEEILEAGNEWYCNICQQHQQAYKIMQFHYSYLPTILILTLKRFEYRDISNISQHSNMTIHREKIDHFIDFPITGLNVKKYCAGTSTGAGGGGAGGGGEGGGRARKPSVDLDATEKTKAEVQKEVISNEEEKEKKNKATSSEKGKNEGEIATADDENDAIYDLFAICNHYGRMGFGHYTAYVKDWPLYEEVTGNTLPPNKPPASSSSGSGGDWYLYDDNSVVKVTEKEIKTSSAYILFYRKRTNANTSTAH